MDEEDTPGLRRMNAIGVYSMSLQRYAALAQQVASILEDVLRERNIAYHSVPFRAKTMESYIAKTEVYDDPVKDIQDMAGIRIITYVESQALQAARVVSELFAIDVENSVNKTVELGVDQMGYRAVHYIASLTEERCRLPDFAKFHGMVFEVQVRTILQHAWAEVEHDRNYKFSGVLPDEIKRRFALLAGSLELLDREFDRLAEDIDKYALAVAEMASTGELDIAIDNISLRQFLADRFSLAISVGQIDLAEEDYTHIIHILRGLDITTLADLSDVIPSDFDDRLARAPKPEGAITPLSVLVALLLVARYHAYLASLRGKFRVTPDHLAWWTNLGVDVEAMRRDGHLFEV